MGNILIPHLLRWVQIKPFMLTEQAQVFLTDIIGGIIMGLGFALGGFCPGTSFSAAAIGKIDAMVFSVGLFIGIFIFSEIYPVFEGFYNSGNMGGAKIYDLLGMRESVFAFLLIVAAVGMFYGAAFVEKKVKKVEY